jgi:NAD(P)-dependent dehydrogenase (short-subunit alcohol dehydrogenase family)
LLSTPDITRYKPCLNHLEKRIILVTGAGDGIGKAVAIGAAKSGATVILAGRTVAKLEQVYKLIIEAGGPEPSLDGLLHNAAILGLRSPLTNYSSELWSKVIQVNLTAQFQMTQSLMTVLEKSQDASVIFTTSGVGRVGKAFWGAYAVSKFAIEGMVQTWASEVEGLGSVRINAINPGATRTNMRAQAFPGENPNDLKTPEDILPAYLYLLGQDSIGVNGQSIEAQLR